MEQLPKLGKEPIITVGIMHAERIEFFFDSPFRCAEMPNITFDGEYEVFLSDDGRVSFFEQQFDALHFTPIEEQDYTSEDGYFELEDVVIGINFHWERKENQRFKGGLTFMIEHGKVVAINEIPTEAYIFSVISSEMSATASLELLKAHAVISRSWLLKPIIHNEHNANAVLEHRTEDELIKWYERDSHELYNVCADDHCQRYQGITRARTENVRLAIEATRGLVLMSHGEICDARFSKSCGGVSEVFESCWADKHYSYLERVVDSQQTIDNRQQSMDLTIEANAEDWIRGEYDSFCNTHDKEILSQVLNNYDQETTDFYRWTVEYTTEQLSELVARRSGIDFGTITALEPVERGTSGRLTRLRIVGTKRTMIVGKELEIRRWLSESHLYSSAFVVDKTDTGFRLIGAGWGHGVGLCQIGAAVMGAKGYKYDEILYHYFVDSQLSVLYE
ncbi:MAG: SpoIID/LytB domain-containing protein [Paludibacteraceae bacterium]|nr:SpoIID/LytB domain-containing protein [Paludibacteraceae bacterium]